MTEKPSPEEVVRWQHRLAGQANNRAWSLSEQASRSAAEDEEMLNAELVPKLRTPRLARSVIRGRSVRSPATYRNRPAVGNALFATSTIAELISPSQHANGARIEPA